MEQQEFDFESQYDTDDEVEKAINSLVIFVQNQVVADESRPAIINPYRLKHIAHTYKLMRYMTNGTDAEVSYKLHEPFQSMGSVTVEGDDILIGSSSQAIQWFLGAAKLASNFEVYPLTNGKVRMTFTFHGLTTPIQ